MGEVIGLFVLIAAVAAGAAGIVNKLNSNQHHKVLAHTPVPLLSNGNTDDALVKARQYYNFSLRSIHILMQLLQKDSMVPFLSETDRNTIQSIVDEFNTNN